jgi:hypothetical protein
MELKDRETQDVLQGVDRGRAALAIRRALAGALMVMRKVLRFAI